jgi:hypothetical protein
MDLLDLKPKSETIEVILTHPVSLEPICKEDGTEMSITVYAPHSKVYKEALHEQTNRRIQKAQKTKKFTLTSEDAEQSSLEVLARVTKEWDIVVGGKTPKMDFQTAMDLYREYPWIKEQIEEAINDTASFLKA